MRFSKVFFPLALAASAIAADPYPALDALKKESQEVIVLVNSISPDNSDRIVPEIANKLFGLADTGVRAVVKMEDCKPFHLFTEPLDAALGVIIKHHVDLGPFNQLLAPALRKWEDVVDRAAFALIQLSESCRADAKAELRELEQHLTTAEQASGIRT